MGKPASLSQDDSVAATLVSDIKVVRRKEPTPQQIAKRRQSGVLTRLATQPMNRRRKALKSLDSGPLCPGKWLHACLNQTNGSSRLPSVRSFPRVAAPALAGTTGGPGDSPLGAGRIPTGDGPRSRPRGGMVVKPFGRDPLVQGPGSACSLSLHFTTKEERETPVDGVGPASL